MVSQLVFDPRVHMHAFRGCPSAGAGRLPRHTSRTGAAGTGARARTATARRRRSAQWCAGCCAQSRLPNRVPIAAGAQRSDSPLVVNHPLVSHPNQHPQNQQKEYITEFTVEAANEFDASPRSSPRRHVLPPPRFVERAVFSHALTTLLCCQLSSFPVDKHAETPFSGESAGHRFQQRRRRRLREFTSRGWARHLARPARRRRRGRRRRRRRSA